MHVLGLKHPTFVASNFISAYVLSIPLTVTLSQTTMKPFMQSVLQNMTIL